MKKLLSAAALFVMLVAVTSGQQKHLVKMQITITYDSLTLAQSAETESQIQKHFEKEKCVREIKIIDLPESLPIIQNKNWWWGSPSIQLNSITPYRWHNGKIDTSIFLR